MSLKFATKNISYTMSLSIRLLLSVHFVLFFKLQIAWKSTKDSSTFQKNVSIFCEKDKKFQGFGEKNVLGWSLIKTEEIHIKSCEMMAINCRKLRVVNRKKETRITCCQNPFNLTVKVENIFFGFPKENFEFVKSRENLKE